MPHRPPGAQPAGQGPVDRLAAGVEQRQVDRLVGDRIDSSPGNCRRSQPAICSGDQQVVSFSYTSARSLAFLASLAVSADVLADRPGDRLWRHGRPRGRRCGGSPVRLSTANAPSVRRSSAPSSPRPSHGISPRARPSSGAGCVAVVAAGELLRSERETSSHAATAARATGQSR
jgi:hypothetical protein